MSKINEIKKALYQNNKDRERLLNDYVLELAGKRCCVYGCQGSVIKVKNLFNSTLYPVCENHENALWMVMPGPQINPEYKGKDLKADDNGRIPVFGIPYVQPF